MHLKNFSLLYNENDVVLSPAYDLLNVNLVNPKDDEELGLTLNAKKKKLKQEDFIVLANALNIPEKAYQNTFKKFSLKNGTVIELISRSFLNDDQKKAYENIWLQKQKMFN
ncbi:MAG: type toxin-antitoxin system HipA family toxin [Segetibacter sp.]|nr:type toxin-antitoxin system HipA family toxin [Segetibacter sp.]